MLPPFRPLTRLLCLWHLASLDAPTVALVWAAAFAWSARIRIPGWWWIAIPCAVWTVYVGDRLLDVWGRRADLQARHRFHWRHRRWLWPAAAGTGLATGWLVLKNLPPGVLRRDSLVGLAAAAYFSGVHGRATFPGWVRRLVSRLVSRELIVGLVFTAGCLLPAWSSVDAGSRTLLAVRMAVPFAFFSALAWLNVRAIEWWENPGARCPRPAMVWLAMAGTAAAGMVPNGRLAALLGCGAASCLLLALLDRLRPEALVRRALADLVLLTPVLLLASR